MKKINLEAALLRTMQVIDNQIAREMQRSPAQRDLHGVEKWEPIQTRVERVSSLILEAVSKSEAKLESLLVLSQAFTKALSIYIRELEKAGLGEVRTAYCRSAVESIQRDCFLASQMIAGQQEVN
ncbi:MAG: hypothetical protein R3A13_08790 [Bdellovibrionota bacterium]